MNKKIFFLCLFLMCGFGLFAQEYVEYQYTIDDNGLAGERFAASMASENTTLVVGSPQKQVVTNPSQGYAYIYEKSSSGISLVKRISAFDGEASDLFGTSVAISGDILVVGAQNKTVGTNFFQGAAYIFARNQGGTNNWGLVKQLIASDGVSNDFFGHAVAINSSYIAVSAYSRDSKKGAVYLFGKNQGGANNWGEIRTLTASDAAANDYFGQSLAINSSSVAVGANGVQSNKGAVYVYTLSNGTELQKMTASDGMASDEFGYSLAMDENTLLTGARNNLGYQGAAYVFAKASTSWTEKKKIVANDAVGGDAFGYSVALSNNSALIGARVKKVGNNIAQGAVYVFSQNKGGTNNWGQNNKLTANDGGFAENFGETVAFVTGDVFVSAPSHKVSGKNTLGQIYHYQAIAGNNPQTSGTYYANQSITDKAGWTHFWNNATNYLILSVKLNGQSLGTKLTSNPTATTDYSVAVNVANPRTVQNIHAPYVTNPNGWWVAPNTWAIKTNKVSFGKNITLRTYYEEGDVQSVIDSANAFLANIQSVEDIKFFSLPKGTTPFNNTHDGADSVFYIGYGQMSSDSTWTQGSWNDKPYAEFITKSLTGGGLAAAGGNGEPFSSDIISISASNLLAINEVKWSIRKDADNKAFTVEHSRDAVNFTSIGTISKDQPDTNDSTAIFFSFKDYQPFGKTYYRLKQIDSKGFTSYSYMVNVKVKDTILIYPNPTEAQVNIIYSYSLFKSPYNITVTNMAGQVMWNGDVESEDAAGIIRLDMADLPSGVYVINAVDSLKQSLGQARFVKQ